MTIDRLSAEDSLMLRGDELWPQDIGAIVLLEGAPLTDPAGGLRIDVAREAIGARLHLVPRFRQLLTVPRRGLGGPLWVDNPGFDLSEHVRALTLPAPAGEAELLRAAEQIRRSRLDRSRPLWEMWFLTGLADGRVGLFVRTHHAIADGIAAMRTIGRFLDADPEAPLLPAPAWSPAPPPSESALLTDNLRRRTGEVGAGLANLGHPIATARGFREAVPALRELFAGEPGPVTSLHRLIGPERRLALVDGELDRVKEVADRHDSTVNDVLLAATAGGLSAFLRSRGEAVETLPIYVPVSLRRGRSGPAEGNLIGQMVVPLPMGESDPDERLRRIAATTAERKARARTSVGSLFRGRAVSVVMLAAVKRQRVNVLSANVAGPSQPLYLAGARVLEVFPILNLIGTVALGIGALSYAGTFDIAVTADGDAFPDVEVLATGLRREMELLGAAPVGAGARG